MDYLSVYFLFSLGIIRDKSDSYNGVFLILIITQAGAALLYIGDFMTRRQIWKQI